MPLTTSGQYESALPAALRPSGFDSAVAGDISKMDTVYSDLVESQTLLEHQNAALEETPTLYRQCAGGDD
ncbi:hypothetical protein WGT02_32475 (plasmid) [Rhizobium sp. T1470]|uniref:hypothetical protein n=1 Tax=unclassified Rhizobium TaxID=2613769 RepID=UPI001AAF9E88|nr:hypothetical protein [Rhizobium sp. T1473]MCA0806451.1 hypothetical protein [Rhizobium sp. T1473]